MHSHSLIQLINISYSVSHKTCFEDFSVQVPFGSKIALIGSNGSGKSTLLKILYGTLLPCSGELFLPKNANIGYVPQVIETDECLSGGERFNKALTWALRDEPNLLLLDEPTNHLDLKNRKSLIKMLQVYAGTLILASHDVELLKNNIDILWHLDKGKVHVFSGSYENYMNEQIMQRASIEHSIRHLKKQKKETHQALMTEQNRAAKRRSQGEKNIEQRKWPTVISKTKVGRANKTSDKLKATIGHKKQVLLDKLSDFKLTEVVVPKFNLSSSCQYDRVIVSVRAGVIGYKNNELILRDIVFSMNGKDRVAIKGNNGSGKSTLVKAMLGDASILREGEWHTPSINDIGYLDQHYQNLKPNKMVFDIIQECVPNWESTQIRRFLSDFLFRKNEEVNLVSGCLSEGEKARLSLALIAVKTPKLLILDEITNNLDIITREHIIQVFKHYPGAMIVISHDEDFLQEINVVDKYIIKNSTLEKE